MSNNNQDKRRKIKWEYYAQNWHQWRDDEVMTDSWWWSIDLIQWHKRIDFWCVHQESLWFQWHE